MGSFKPTTYLTTEELQQLASAKFEEAAALPDGPEREQVLKEFVAANDDAAFEHARQFFDAYDVELFIDGRDAELWKGERFVAKLKSDWTGH